MDYWNQITWSGFEPGPSVESLKKEVLVLIKPNVDTSTDTKHYNKVSKN